MNFCNAANIEDFRRFLSILIKKPVAYDPQIDRYVIDNMALEITFDPRGTTGKVECNKETFYFEYDIQTGKHIPM